MNMGKWAGEKEINTRLRALTRDVQALREELQASLKREPSHAAPDPNVRDVTDEPPRRRPRIAKP